MKLHLNIVIAGAMMWSALLSVCIAPAITISILDSIMMLNHIMTFAPAHNNTSPLFYINERIELVPVSCEQ